MRSAFLYRYRLPMDSGVILREAHLTEKQGLVVKLSLNGKTALGEIAPLLGFSHESLDEAAAQTLTVLEAWCLGEAIELDKLYPSVAFGLSVAFAELENTLPLAGNFQLAPLCSGDPDELVEKLLHLEGEQIIKIKVGLYEVIRDGLLVNMLLEAFATLKLRLDANQRWTLEKALTFASYIDPAFRKRIAFIEEPCQSMEQSLNFAKETGINIAFDESTRAEDFTLSLAPHFSAIVVKPSLVGSIEKVASLVAKAHALGLEVVISSSLETSLGLNHLARLANWLTPNTRPGLDTLSLFAAQLERPWPDSTLPIVSLNQSECLWQSH